MKLKKIAALALAGVMAVSMLAGCAGKGTTDEGKTETTDLAAAVAAAVTEKGVSFSSDAELNKLMSDAVLKDGLGSLSNSYKFDVTEVNLGEAVKKNQQAGTTPAYKDEEKEAVGYYVATPVTASEEIAVKELAKQLDQKVEQIAKNGLDDAVVTKVTGTSGAADEFYRTTFAFTGKVGVYTHTSDLGVTTYYMVYTITRTGSTVKM